MVPPTDASRRRIALRAAPVGVLLGGGALGELLRVSTASRHAALGAVFAGGTAALALAEFASGRQRRDEQKALSAVLQDADDTVLLVRDQRVVDVRGNVEETLGLERSAAIGVALDDVLRTDDPQRVAATFGHALGQRDRGASVRGLPIHHGSTRTRFVDVTVRDCVATRGVRAFVVTLSDATERVVAQQQLAHAAANDSETFLANRERFLEQLDMALHRARRRGDHVAVLVAGLDRYSDLVAAYDESDRSTITREVAQRIRGAVRVEDAVGRLSDETFGVVLGSLEPKIGRAYAIDVADRIVRDAEMPFGVDGGRVELHVSIGASHRSQGSVEPSAATLVRDAEQSLVEVRANTDRWKDASPA